MGIAMVPLDVLAATPSPYLAAGIGLVGSLIGGVIAGTVSLRVAEQAHRLLELKESLDGKGYLGSRATA